MPPHPPQLPCDPAALARMVLDLDAENARLRQMVEALKALVFGAKSEKAAAIDPNQGSLDLGDLATEAVPEANDNAAGKTRPVGPRRPARRNVGALPRHLPRIETVIEPESTACPCCAGLLHKVGEDIAEALDVVPAIVRVLRVPVADSLVAVFISFFRGTPLLVQLFLFYYGLPQLLPALTSIDGITAAVIGLTLHFSAYMAESIRGAILGVDRSQWEAAQSIGMTQGQLLRRIVLPQASRVAAPTLMNYFIDLIKSTSLAFTLGVTEMMGAAQKEAAGSFLYLEAFLVVAVIYWIMVEALSVGQRWMERRLGKAVAR